MVRHNDLRDGVVDLARKSFTPSHVRNDPLIFSGCAMKRTMEKPAMPKISTSAKKLEATEQKVNLMICELWNNGIEIFHDMRVVNTDAKSHSSKTPENCIQEEERTKKKMYL